MWGCNSVSSSSVIVSTLTSASGCTPPGDGQQRRLNHLNHLLCPWPVPGCKGHACAVQVCDRLGALLRRSAQVHRFFQWGAAVFCESTQCDEG